MSNRALAFFALLAIAGVAVYAYAYDADNYVGDLEDSGLTNPMAGDLDMDGNAILDCSYWESDNADVADAGAIRLGATDIIGWEDSPTGTDHTLSVSGDTLTWTGGPLGSSQDGGGWLTLYDTTDPGDTNGIGQVSYQANTNATTTTARSMCSSRMEVTDATNAAEYADLRWSCITNGAAATEYMRIDSSDGQVEVKALASQNADVADTGFIRLASSDAIAWEASPSGSDSTLTRSNDALVWNGNTLRTGTGAGGYINVLDATAPGNTAAVAQVGYHAFDSASNEHTMCSSRLEITSATNPNEYGDLFWRCITNGNAGTEYMRIDSSDGVVKFPLGLAHANGTAIPATCAVGEMFLDTDSDDCADTGGGDGCLCICKTANTWAVVQNI